MYTLVNDVGAYPDFLYWCRSATVHLETEDMMEASLELSSKGMSKVFTTRNRLQPHRSIEIGLVDGPFRHLEGRWLFEVVDEEASFVELEMRFEFDNPIKGLFFGTMFEDIANSLVDSFVRQARSVYGR